MLNVICAKTNDREFAQRFLSRLDVEWKDVEKVGIDVLGPTTLDRSQMRRSQKSGAIEQREDAAAIFEQGAHSGVAESAQRVQGPTLILWAARGDFPRRHFENLAARMPDARVRDADAGHFVPMERPDLVVAVALEAVEIKPTA